MGAATTLAGMRPESFRQLFALAERLAPLTRGGREYGPEGAMESVGLLIREGHDGWYDVTPVGADVFASTGGDGVHYSFLPIPGGEAEPPVVMTVPMHFDRPNLIVGETLTEFLELGCCYRFGYAHLDELAYAPQKTIAELQSGREIPIDQGDDSVAVLKALTEHFSLKPWPDVSGRLAELDKKYMPHVVEQEPEEDTA